MILQKQFIKCFINHYRYRALNQPAGVVNMLPDVGQEGISPMEVGIEEHVYIEPTTTEPAPELPGVVVQELEAQVNPNEVVFQTDGEKTIQLLCNYRNYIY